MSILAAESNSAALLVAAIAAASALVVAVIGYLATSRNDRRQREAEAQLRHTERQLEELYGPLAFLVIEGRRTFIDLLDSLHRSFVFRERAPLSDEDLKTWLFWAENDLMPRNEKIEEILMANTHLIEGDQMPAVYEEFLDHHNSWKINHLRWKTDGTEYGWHSKTHWPAGFQEEVLATFRLLKSRHAALLGETAGQSLIATSRSDPEPAS